MKEIIESLLELVYPTFCVGCGRFGKLVCRPCLDLIPFIDSKICLKCGKPSRYLVEECRDCRKKQFAFYQARSLGFYQGNLRELIHKFKYGNCRGLAEVFADLLIDHIEPDFFSEVELLTCVPLSRKKQDERGFNQAQLLAVNLARKLNVQFSEALCQNRETKDQSKLEAAERRKNIKGAFTISIDLPPKGCRVLLVDDVFTTGSTVNECSRVLKASGAASVKVITIARSTHFI